jgi:cell division protein FtsW (lipid II flippase)
MHTKKFRLIVFALALSCFAYFFNELIALENRTRLGYELLCAGIALNLVLSYTRNSAKEKK